MGLIERTREAGQRDADPASDSDRASAAAARLGVPVGEVTPHVRTALAALTREIERLKRELAGLRRRADEAERAANQDTLLSLLNRRAFLREAGRAIAALARYGTPASLVYFDLDSFKAINDARGHAAGDAVLNHFASILAANVRGTDAVARVGGDEFAVLLLHTGIERARAKGESLCAVLRDNPPIWEAEPLSVTCCFGVHELRAGDTAESALSNADLAMYVRKQARGDQKSEIGNQNSEI
ncbi:MAG: GGDEF domain-containing protein [Alphaproteobacteria bacterium]